MAKRRKKLSPKTVTARRGVHFRKVTSYVEVARMPHNPAFTGETARAAARGPFYACVKVGSENRKGHWPMTATCAVGKNPRKAIAAALRKQAGMLAKRPGAFAGLGSFLTRRKGDRR